MLLKRQGHHLLRRLYLSDQAQIILLLLVTSALPVRRGKFFDSPSWRLRQVQTVPSPFLKGVSHAVVGEQIYNVYILVIYMLPYPVNHVSI